MNPARRRFLGSAAGVGGVLAASLGRVRPSSAVTSAGRMSQDAHAIADGWSDSFRSSRFGRGLDGGQSNFAITRAASKSHAEPTVDQVR
jgi:hypothetical protein